jgi:putative redox protein
MDTLNVKLQTLDDKTKFSATARENPEVIIDYFPPIGTGQGYTSLEMLMFSFGSCLSSVVLTLLRFRMKKTVFGITANIEGVVREEHPKSLQSMIADLRIKAADLTDDEVAQALAAAEEAMCPVWAMIKANVEVETKVTIENT